MVYLPWRRRPSNLSKLAPPPAEEQLAPELGAVLVLGRLAWELASAAGHL